MDFRDKTLRRFIKVWFTCWALLKSCCWDYGQIIHHFVLFLLPDYNEPETVTPFYMLARGSWEFSSSQNCLCQRINSEAIQEKFGKYFEIVRQKFWHFPRRKLLSFLKCRHAKYLVVYAILYVAYVQYCITQLYLGFNTYVLKDNKTKGEGQTKFFNSLDLKECLDRL